MADPQIEHLLRRGGFGARPDELATYGAMSTKQAVSALVDYDGVPDVVDSLISQPGYIGMTISGAFSRNRTSFMRASAGCSDGAQRPSAPGEDDPLLANHFATGYNKIAGALGATEARAVSRGQGGRGSGQAWPTRNAARQRAR
jgi:hypothetical protein